MGKTTVTPWQGLFWDDALHDDMRIPQQGEVGWLLPDGAKLYWRGRTTSLRYAYN
jgi:hypothetical protein